MTLLSKLSIGVCLAAPASVIAANAYLDLPGRDYLLTNRLVSAVVFHWFTTGDGQRSGPWRPVEGRSNWTGEAPFWVRQIKDIMDANIDVMYVHLMPDMEQQRINLFAAYSQLRAAGYDVPAIAPMLDPMITWDILPPIDLATTAGKDAFVSQYIRFFNQYFSQNTDTQAESHLLHINGKIVLNTWHCYEGYTNHASSLTRSDVESRLAAAFGNTYPTFNNGMYMVATANDPAPSFADEQVHQFSTLAYYDKVTCNSRKTAGLCPGYWDQNIRNPGHFRARAGGSQYVTAWAHLISIKDGVQESGESAARPVYHANITSWNEYDEGSGLYAANPGPPYIAPSNLSGNNDVWSSTNNPREYIDTTAAYASSFNDRPVQDARFLGHTIPATVLSGQTTAVQITVRNEGNTAWSNTGGYQLGQPGLYLYHWTFDRDANSWTLVANAFGTSGNTAYETGDWNSAYGQTGGGLRTRVGSVNTMLYPNGASAGFAGTFHLDAARNVLIGFKWRLVMAGTLEPTKYCEARFELDNVPHGAGGQSYLGRFTGGLTSVQDTGWRNYVIALPLSGPGDHTIEIGRKVAMGDLDDDGDVDQEDFGHLQVCLTGGAAQPPDPGCMAADLDGDGSVDVEDLALFQSCFSGPDQISPCNAPNTPDEFDDWADVYIDDVWLADPDTPGEITPSRISIDETANEIAAYGGAFRGRPTLFNFQLTAPTRPGLYNLSWQMLQGSGNWFGPRYDMQLNVVNAD
jgi:hypothetical protein